MTSRAVEAVISRAAFDDGVAELAQDLGRSIAEVHVEAVSYVAEIASLPRASAVTAWARVSRRIYGRAYRLDVDLGQVERIREASRSHQLVFLPSHRSNLDPYVLNAVTADVGLPANRVLGGVNLAFWPLGPIARQIGAVFIRRSFKDNPVYRWVLSHYLAFLAEEGDNLEWYLEGGRSRTGKLLPPRLGLLTYLADAAEEQKLDDVLLVPTAITYDVLHEVGEMTAELRGRRKTAEGLGWFLNFIRQQGRRGGEQGTIHVGFDDPIPLTEALAAYGSSEDADPAVRRVARHRVAIQVCAGINRQSWVTAPALVCMCLLGATDRALTLPEITTAMRPFLDYVDARPVPAAPTVAQMRTDAGLEQTLALMEGHGLVARFADGPQSVYRVGDAQELAASFYRNGIIHWFVVRAIGELAVLRAGESRTDDSGWGTALQLRDLLKHEFFFDDRKAYSASLVEELRLVEATWSPPAPLPAVDPLLARVGTLVADQVLRSFLDAYRVVALHLVDLADRAADPDDARQSCLGLGEQLRWQRILRSHESISTSLFENGLKLASGRGLLEAGRAAERAAFLVELESLLATLDRVAQLHDALFETSLVALSA